MSKPIDDLISNLKQFPSHTTATWPNSVLVEAISNLYRHSQDIDEILKYAIEIEIADGFIEAIKEAGWIVPNSYENLFSAVRHYRRLK